MNDLRSDEVSLISNHTSEHFFLFRTQPTRSPSKLPTHLPSINPSSSPSLGPTQQPSSQVLTIVKYMCANKPKDTANICADGAPVLGSNCLSEGASCGGGGKYCQLAECPNSINGPTPPSPTNPPMTSPPSLPTGGCLSAGTSCNNNSDCCSNSCTKSRGRWTCDI